MGHISTIRRNGKIHGYSVYLGVDGNGRRLRKFFTDYTEAEKHTRSRDLRPISVDELWERKSELMFNLERLRPLGTNLTDVVTFYLNHQGSVMGQTKLSELFDQFLKEKLQVGRSSSYEKNMRKCFSSFMKTTGGDRKIGEVSRGQISDYVYQTNRHLSNVSKKNILTNLSVIFNHAVRRDLLEKNPVEKIDRPTIPFVKPSVLSPSDFEKLLRRCVWKKWDDRLVTFVLVGFCGIRVEEASRLKWTNLQLDKRIVEVPATVAKKASFRNNVIPPNAMEWLRSVEDKRRTGPLIGKNWRTHLRNAVISSKINFQKNCIRHSFCSYSLASGWSLSDVSS